MFNIVLKGEIVETVFYDDINDCKNYVRENYHFYGDYPSIRRVKE